MRFIANTSFAMVLLLSSCSETATETVSSELKSPFRWVEGKFIYTEEQSGYYYEEWNRQDDNTYSGSGYYLTRDCVDTIFRIKMQLIHDKQKTTLFYDVKGQNDNKETEFTLTKGENGIYVFENPFRSFPSIMQYKLIGNSGLEVIERGFSDNKEKVVQYKLKKIN